MKKAALKNAAKMRILRRGECEEAIIGADDSNVFPLEKHGLQENAADLES